MGLVVSLATRGRPESLLRTVALHLRCLSRRDTVMVVAVDSDDEATIKVLPTLQALDDRIWVDVRDREDVLCDKWNRCLNVPGEAYLVVSDDNALTSPDSDEKILHGAGVFPDGIGVIYGPRQNGLFSAVQSYSANWIEAFGWMEPPYFPYWFGDHWLMDLAEMLGRINYIDLTTESRKAWKKTQEVREPRWWADWYDAAYLFRRKQALKVLWSEQFATPQWMKEVLTHSFPAVEQKSRLMNDEVRNRASEFEGWHKLPLDERYLRAKVKAIRLLPQLFTDMPEAEEDIWRYKLEVRSRAQVAA